MPASPRFFRKKEISDAKNAKNSFEKPKLMVRSDKILDEKKEQYKKWITAFRANPSLFAEIYLGVKLYPYQKLMLYALQKSDLTYIVASRATAKSYIIGLWSVCLAILYPGIKIVICAKTLKQGGIIISEKIANMRDTYSNIEREISSLTCNANLYEVIFHNGSTIRVVPSSDNARGNRAGYIIVEESRFVDKDILEQVIKPFLEVRTPPYRLLSEYQKDKRWEEEGRISYITSSGSAGEWWMNYVKSTIKRMVSGDETATFLAFDYLISVYHGIKTMKMVQEEMRDSDPITVEAEYLNLIIGGSSRAYYKSNMFKRSIKRAFYPQKTNSFNPKRNPYEIKKLDGELRFVAIDVATRANKTNDQSIIGCIRCIPTARGYERNLVYVESHKGANTIVQAKRINEIFADFYADYLVIDLQNAGVGIFDSLSQINVSDERGLSFDAMTVADSDIIEEKLREELTKRTLGLNANPVIFPILATQNLNSQMAVAFRSSLQNKLWNFLTEEGVAEEFLLKTNKEFTSEDNESWAFFLNPYVQTSLLIGECINLDMTLVNGMIKLTEKQGAYKDRFSMIEYANWIISQFDKELLKEVDSGDDNDWLAVTQIL